MIVRNPAWLIVAAVFIAHATGILQMVGGSISAIDTTIGDTIKVKNWIKAKEVAPKKVAHKQVQHEKVAHQ